MLTSLAHWHTLYIVRALIDNVVSVADGVGHVQVVKCDCVGLISAGGQQPNFARGLVNKTVEQHCKNSLL